MFSLLLALSQDVGTDCLCEVFTFLPPETLAQLGGLNHSFYASTRSDALWKFYCITLIPFFAQRCPRGGQHGHQQQHDATGHDEVIEMMNAIKDLTGCPNYYHLYIAFRRLSFPLIGWFRLVPLYHGCGQHDGGLFCVLPCERRLWLLRLGLDDNDMNDHNKAIIIYVEEMKKLVCVPPHGVGRSLFVAADRMVLLDSYGAVDTQLLPLPHRLDAGMFDDQHYLSIARKVESCLGLFSAPYGSHGIEILHLSLRGGSQQHIMSPPLVEGVDFGPLQLYGLKITGDSNVPAGQLSFIINLLSPVDVSEEVLAEDERPVFMFSPPHDAIRISLVQRRPYIKSWMRGYGQINRNPSVWRPEWVGCKCIFYHTPPPSTFASFTIVWDDESESFRHAMDFRAVRFDSRSVNLPDLL